MKQSGQRLRLCKTSIHTSCSVLLCDTRRRSKWPWGLHWSSPATESKDSTVCSHSKEKENWKLNQNATQHHNHRVYWEKHAQTYGGSLAKECVGLVNKKQKSVTGWKASTSSVNILLELLLFATVSVTVSFLPASTRAGPVKHFVHRCHTVTAHGRYISAGHNCIVHPRMHCQLLLNTKEAPHS